MRTRSMILAMLGLALAVPAAAQDIAGTWLCYSRNDRREAESWAGAGLKTYDRDGTGRFDLKFEGAFNGLPVSMAMVLRFDWDLSGDRLYERATDGQVRSLVIDGADASDAPIAQALLNDLFSEDQTGTLRRVSDSFFIVDWRDDWDSCIRQ